MNYYDLLPYTGMPARIIDGLRDHSISLNDPKPYLLQNSYFHGPTGAGKSLFAAHILATSLREHTHIPYYLGLMDPKSPDYNPNYPGPVLGHRFCWYPKLLQSIKRTFNSFSREEDLMDPITTADFLVLDDIGPEIATEWSYNILYLLVGERYDNNLPTIFTSNLSPRDLQAKFQDTRIVSRIMGMCGDRIYEIKGTDKRLLNTRLRT